MPNSKAGLLKDIAEFLAAAEGKTVEEANALAEAFSKRGSAAAEKAVAEGRDVIVICSYTQLSPGEVARTKCCVCERDIVHALHHPKGVSYMCVACGAEMVAQEKGS